MATAKRPSGGTNRSKPGVGRSVAKSRPGAIYKNMAGDAPQSMVDKIVGQRKKAATYKPASPRKGTGGRR